MGLSFPEAQFLRCLWHLGRLVADLRPLEARLALQQDCRGVPRAPTWDEALARYATLKHRRNWLERAPESCRALAEGFEGRHAASAA